MVYYDPASGITTYTYAPPPENVLHTLTVALSKNYGSLTGSDEELAFIPEFRQLRDKALLLWSQEESLPLTNRHITTLLNVLTRLEDLGLSRYPGLRQAQRTACGKADPSFLREITRARGWVKQADLYLKNGHRLPL